MTPQLMGIVNATPDSFYDGDPQNNLASLLAKCKDYVRDGADILDVGGESTRPSAEPVPEEEEKARVLPLIAAVRREWPKIPVSLDTVKIPVALEGLKAGDNIINDVSGTPQTMQTQTEYSNLLGEIKDFLARKIDEAVSCGIAKQNVIIDVGFGFAKTREQNYELLKHLAFFKALGVRMLVGLSRKTFLSQKCEGAPKRKAQTLAANLVALQNGADILRVHDVKETRKIINFYEELESSK